MSELSWIRKSFQEKSISLRRWLSEFCVTSRCLTDVLFDIWCLSFRKIFIEGIKIESTETLASNQNIKQRHFHLLLLRISRLSYFLISVMSEQFKHYYFVVLLSNNIVVYVVNVRRFHSEKIVLESKAGNCTIYFYLSFL